MYKYGLCCSCKLKILKHYMDGETKNILKDQSLEIQEPPHMVTLIYIGVQKMKSV